MQYSNNFSTRRSTRSQTANRSAGYAVPDRDARRRAHNLPLADDGPAKFGAKGSGRERETRRRDGGNSRQWMKENEEW